jgi:nicotinate-nucleotide pyrophosphorylase (carboxylating)
MLAAMEAAIEQLIRLALAEDIGGGDVTAGFFIPAGRQARGLVVARQQGVISGVAVAAEVFRQVEAATAIRLLAEDGDRVAAGARLLEVRGRARALVTAERTALNFLQRLSGVATLTAHYVEAIRGTTARILDTRKTTPGWRLLEKRAVVHGGGLNHRFGLYDRALVKDNHLVAGGGIAALAAAIRRLKAERPGIEVELEADRPAQAAVFLTLAGVDHILLDNMEPADLRRVVALRGGVRPLLEASGGVTLETVRTIAETGVDFISVGALTHSAPALDIGLDFVSLDGP